MKMIGAILLLTSIASFSVDGTVLFHSDDELKKDVIMDLESSAPSTTVLDFISYYNGNYDNDAQPAELGNPPETSIIRIIPIAIECLQNDQVVFMQQGTSYRVDISYLSVVKDGLDDGSVSLTTYLFTNPSKYTSQKMFSVDTLPDIPCEDFQEVKSCTSQLTFGSDGLWYGNIHQCLFSFYGKYPELGGIISCNRLTVSLPSEYKQRPFEFQRRGPKYPLINPPPGYVPPCGE